MSLTAGVDTSTPGEKDGFHELLNVPVVGDDLIELFMVGAVRSTWPLSFGERGGSTKSGRRSRIRQRIAATVHQSITLCKCPKCVSPDGLSILA